MDLPFDVSYEEVGPAMAAEYLGRNRANRKLKKMLVASLVRDILAGKWLINHQGIAFNREGDLIDGQHRLTAIVKADRPANLLIFRNVPTSQDGTKTMHVIDRGVARTVGDSLELENGVAQGWMVAAVASSLAALALQTADRTRRPSVPQVLAVVERWREHIAYAVENRSRQTGLKCAVVQAAVALARAVHREKVEEFYRAFVTGVGLAEGSAVLALRNDILGRPAAWRKGSERHRLELGNIVLNALHAHVRGLGVARLTGGGVGAEFFLSSQKASVAAMRELFPFVSEGKVNAPAEKPAPARKSLPAADVHAPAKPRVSRIALLKESLARVDARETR